MSLEEFGWLCRSQSLPIGQVGRVITVLKTHPVDFESTWLPKDTFDSTSLKCHHKPRTRAIIWMSNDADLLDDHGVMSPSIENHELLTHFSNWQYDLSHMS